MYRRIKELNRRFLVIFHNGSSEEIDLGSYGFPLSEHYDNKVLWTFQGRFRLYPKMKVDRALNKSTEGRVATYLVLLASSHIEGRDPQEMWSSLVRQEAAEIITNTTGGPARVAEFFILFMMRLCCISYNLMMDYDLATHACQLLDLFQDLGKITVLKLSRRTFSFTSPPFVHCHNLKFLWLDHCQDQEMISSSIDGFLQDEKKKLTQDEDGAAAKEYIQQCFKRLWVLDIRYTPCNQILSAQMMDAMTQLRELNVMGAEDWDMGQVQGRLPNICKLRITKSAIRCPSGNDADLLLSGMDKVQLLDFSGNQIMKESGKKSLPTTSLPVASSLETVIINDGCVGLEKISFRGCAKLKNILLKGSFQELRILDVSGTAVKTLDLSAVTAAQKLDELLLLDCGKLCAILWPPQEVIRRALLRKVCIDTTMQTSVSTAPRSREEKSKEGSPVATTTGPRAPSQCDRFVSVRDARLLRSLVPLEEHFNFVVHVEISSPLSHPAIISGGGSKDADSSRSSEQPPLEDGNGGHMQQLMASEGGGRGEEAPTITQISPCPRAPNLPSQNCYTYIQDRDQHPMTFTIPDFICDRAMILHVHDSLSIISIPGPAPLQGSQWTNLKWCRVERCPMLECVFTAPRSLLGDGDACVFYSLSTFWVSQLPKARFIWNWSSSSSTISKLPSGSFLFLAMLHLDCCPSLIYVLPMPIQGLRVLRTLEIMWCGDLVDVFPLEPNTACHATVEFHSLKHICLHELPKLKGICGRWRVYAPKLETIRIKGCWSLRRLPDVRGGSRVECSCEKEWWDSLQWEWGNPNHDPSLYEPIHSPHYKKHLLRTTVLR
ncbi:uncharacterized protein [Miscanthus floridulus]|uniref:uncharacterized protein n=1 Tax=Miscanthus floridulus TaxID=154761 RepID=UPI0034582B0C